MDRMTAKQFKETFPDGVTLVFDDTTPVDTVDWQAENDEEGILHLQGWALPNKNFDLDLDKVEVREDGWVTKDSGRSVLLRPLDKAKAKQIRANMDVM